jgi:DNA helicase IV
MPNTDGETTTPSHDPASTPMTVTTSAAEEQPVVDALFARLDELHSETARRRTELLMSAPTGTPQARAEREAFVALYEDRLRQLESIDDGLVFGRLDRATRAADVRSGEKEVVPEATTAKTAGATTQYIGRIGLRDEEQQQLLVDWRAPAAQDFYQSTAANPADVQRRRHLKVRNRAVIAVQDDLLDSTVSAPHLTEPTPMVGEAALLAAVNEARSGRMRDIVVTLQAEQDRIVRSPLQGVLVVQGAPGTGKTAVALHRAAYLLYTHRERLGSSGVLLLGPNDRFLRYIEDVLPSLGETSVVSATIDDLYPGVAPSWHDEPRTAVVKGDRRMAEVLQCAVRLHRRSPRAPIRLTVEDVTVSLTSPLVERAQRAAERTGDPHNQAREEFCRVVLDDLVSRLAAATGELTDDVGRGQLLRMLHASADVRREVNLCWMPLHPEKLLARLWSDPEALAEASRGLLTAEQRALLHRPAQHRGWASEDIPLLDELAELIGDEPDSAAARSARRQEAAERAEQLRFAQDSLTSLGIDEREVSAERLAERYRSSPGRLDLAERAPGDRRWVYGHLVVDEAQELSQMAWRMLVRRCPTRSMTVVGDVEQTTSPAGAVDWGAVFDIHAPGGWRLEQLTVNYRTPGTVMNLATNVARSGHHTSTVPAGGQAPRSLRAGVCPIAVPASQLDPSLVHRICGDPELVHIEGTTAVIVADTSADPQTAQTCAATDLLADRNSQRGVAVILTATEAKGLEFDTVLVIEPAEFLDLGEHGRRQLYVALTRPTQRLIVVHRRPLPSPFHGLVDRYSRMDSVPAQASP